MIPIIDLQSICKIKEIRTSNIHFQNINDTNISEMNTLFSKGWVLLKIYTTISTESADDDRRVTAEILNYVLGFPHNGVSYVADQHRPEFDQ